MSADDNTIGPLAAWTRGFAQTVKAPADGHNSEQRSRCTARRDDPVPWL